jgi:hypothetical protein
MPKRHRGLLPAERVRTVTDRIRAEREFRDVAAAQTTCRNLDFDHPWTQIER